MKFRYFLLLFVFASCKAPEKSPIEEKEANLERYFASVFKNSISTKDENIILLNNQSCSACRKDVINSLVEKLSHAPTHRTYILMKQDTILMSAITKDKNAKIIFDNTGTAGDFGLNYASDFVYRFKDNELKNMLEVSAASIDSLNLN
ncbi:hypothetical protein [Mucilaginibacter psychrotolerans]|uniref:Uncharacterized protein n=1 Tax=Mucilaginibacter psychrotolerans TaxID=1524096 RepID=A0A4Y8SHH0_9SPHI|nr:hypothetical protein [Mucilaginibacter psychrotolerans]TFF37914.1 hypothetical protein E2R66_10005 [Mucilaginibacter psychrotolerans]